MALAGKLIFNAVLLLALGIACGSDPTPTTIPEETTFTVKEIMGMTVGLAALTSWGNDRFDTLVQGIDLSLVDPGYIN